MTNPARDFVSHSRRARCAPPAAALLVLCGLACAAQAPQPVKVEGGLLQGTSEEGLTVYRGIPFAAPPLGDLRWRPPQPAAKWEGVRKADQFGRSCLQSNPALAGMPAPDEDCLYLNVWTPARKSADKLAVLVWIHGGGFTAGSPPERLYHGEALASKGVVVVSIAYRLGVPGFLAHPALSAESPHHVSGNYGLLDMIAGLEWIQRNIAAFGGNPKRVTISGESAGAIAVSMLCASPLAHGLFQGAISESGGSFGPVRAGGGPGENVQPLAEAERAGEAWLAKAGAADIAGLRRLPADKLLAASRAARGAGWPVMDGYVIPDDQYKLYRAGKYNDTPVLIGYNSDEGATFGPPRTVEAYAQSTRERYGAFADKLLAAYPAGEGKVGKPARDLARDSAFGWHTWSWARLQEKTGKSAAYLYYFDQHPEYPADSPRAGFGSPHGAEVPYVFGHLDLPRLTPPTPADLKLADIIQTYWTNFAKTGNPNGAGLPHWPAYRDSKPEMLYFVSGGANAGPLVSEDGLKTLDSYFEWRRNGSPVPAAK